MWIGVRRSRCSAGPVKQGNANRWDDDAAFICAGGSLRRRDPAPDWADLAFAVAAHVRARARARDVSYHDLGPDYYTQRLNAQGKTRHIRRLVDQLAALGMGVTLHSRSDLARP
jgi:hypothetical protein